MLRKIKSLAHLPITRKDGLEYKDIIKAFDHISEVLQTKHNITPDDPISIIVAGGVCSVMLLKNRDLTKDIDFFTPNPDHIEMISGAQHSLSKDLRQRWPKNWINAEMTAFILQPGCEKVYEHSLEQDCILYQSPVLRVVVADWKYQLVCKIIRAYGMRQSANTVQAAERNGKDLDDALAILQLLVSRSQRPVQKSEFETEAWYHGSAISEEEFAFINDAYVTRFNSGTPIV